MYKILDCTLRDGGYTNNWCFGKDKITDYLASILKTETDFVEVGFLTDENRNENQTLFNDIYEINNYTEQSDKLSVMVASGKYDVKKLPKFENTTIKNIRYIFKYFEQKQALEEIKIIKDKGYNVFVNPTFINQYKKNDLLNLINKVNKILPDYFTIVDSMGVLNEGEFLEFIKIANENLYHKIGLGVHLHNNLNFANKNISSLKKIKLKRNIVLDATLSGIGRGAGNLVLEEYVDIDNNIKKILKNDIEKFSSIDKKNYNIAAKNYCHPFYATYLIKNNIEYKNATEIFNSIPKEFKTKFNKEIIEKLVSKVQK